MALKRISDYALASLPLAGTEMLEIETTGGDSRHVTAQDIADLGGGGGAVASVNGDTGAVIVMAPIAVSLADLTTAVTTGASKGYWRAPYAMAGLTFRASLIGASSSGVFTVDINKNGSTILSTKLTIDASEKTSVTAATPYVATSTTCADDDEFTFDIDTAGTGALGPIVWVTGYAS
jgi:hypothetical protein